MLSTLALVLTLLVGALIGRRLFWGRASTGALSIAALLAAASQCILLSVLPFNGWWFEALPFLGATMCWAPLTAAVVKSAQRIKQARKVAPASPLTPSMVAPLFLISLAPILWFGLADRLLFSERRRWTCDGVIVEKLRMKSNHDGPVLVVRGAHGTDRLEFVPEALFARAQTGKTLVKHSGTALGNLDGQSVRFVDGPYVDDQ